MARVPADLPFDRAGPMLFARGGDRETLRLALILAVREADHVPALSVPHGETAEPRLIYDRFGWRVWNAELSLPVRADAAYFCDGVRHAVRTPERGHRRIAYVSCNGHEAGEEHWDPEYRNVMWDRVASEHAERPFALMLHGGDQLYADGVLHAHPGIKAWREASREEGRAMPLTPDMAFAVEADLLRRYLQLLADPATARLSAEVPSVMMWDDHDIFDGWGSHPPEVQDSPVGQGIFAAARRMFRVFQVGHDPEAPVPAGGLGLAVRLPGLSVLAPDLRSTRRHDRMMSEDAWTEIERMLHETPEGDRILLMSSVPALGPRLSWVEAAMNYIPGAQKYEDDLRDQWQSRTHRPEWRRFLRLLEREVEERGREITLLSGEIHLATRGVMHLRSGKRLHQLVASGIAHPPPPGIWPATLNLLARLGEAPLKGRPIRLHPLPGRFSIYTRERNFLVLEENGTGWRASWELENRGRTPALQI